MAASTASTRLRGPLIVIVAGSRIDVPNLVARREGAENPGPHRDLARKTSVEGEVKLAGNNLYHLKLPGLMDLLRRQIEGTLSRLHPAKFDFGMKCPRVADAARCVADRVPGSRPRNAFGIDLKIFRNVAELDRHLDRYLGHADRG